MKSINYRIWYLCFSIFILSACSGGGDLDDLLNKQTANTTNSDNSNNNNQNAAENTVSHNTYAINGVSFKMIEVEGGTFSMGATLEQGNDAYDNEKPAHSVTLSTFYIGETEVTQELWQAVMGSNPSIYQGTKRPVHNVSWEDCQTFLSTLNSLTGRTFRLPTEAEWEYAARGGNKSKGYKYAGSNTIEDVACYSYNSYLMGESSPFYGPQNVGGKTANELGLYDMSGNVYEPCQDWLGSYSSSSQTNPAGPSGSTTGYRTVRGGCWINAPIQCRVSFRQGFSQGGPYQELGLRLAL